jgi:hypothetical protein
MRYHHFTFSYLRNMTSFFFAIILFSSSYWECICFANILFSSIRYGVIDEVRSSHTVIGYAICLNKGFQESLTEFFLLSQLCTFSHLQEISCFHSCMIFSLTSVQWQRKWTFCRVCYEVEFNILQKIRLKP